MHVSTFILTEMNDLKTQIKNEIKDLRDAFDDLSDECQTIDSLAFDNNDDMHVTCFYNFNDVNICVTRQ